MRTWYRARARVVASQQTVFRLLLELGAVPTIILCPVFPTPPAGAHGKNGRCSVATNFDHVVDRNIAFDPGAPGGNAAAAYPP